MAERYPEILEIKLEPCEPPPARGVLPGGYWRQIVKGFIESGLEACYVERSGRSPEYLASCLRKHIRPEDPCMTRVGGGGCFLVKVPVYDRLPTFDEVIKRRYERGK